MLGRGILVSTRSESGEDWCLRPIREREAEIERGAGVVVEDEES